MDIYSRTYIAFFVFILLIGSGLNASAADIESGRTLYLKYGCAVCHGKEGYGDGPVAGRLYSRPTDFHVAESYLVGPSSPEMKSVIIKGFKNDQSLMPAFKDIPDHEVDQIVAFLLSLQQNHEDGKK